MFSKRNVQAGVQGIAKVGVVCTMVWLGTLQRLSDHEVMTRRLVDNDEFSQFMQDSRAADTKMVSSVADAQQIIQQFAGRTGKSPWQSLDRRLVGKRLHELVANPRLFDQGALNLCGPATFLCMWTGRDPVAFARFATTLFEDGSAAIGSMQVTPSSALVQQNYLQMLARMQDSPVPEADWMTMGAIRNNSDSVFIWKGDPGQELPGLTLPEELTTWLRATGIYQEVRNEANWATLAGWPHASNLLSYGGQDVALLLNTNALLGGTARALRNSNTPGRAEAPTATANPATPEDRLFLKQFPNHFVMLLNSPTTSYDPADAKSGSTWLSIWTWAQSLSYEVPAPTFVANYYGAVVALLP